MQFRKTSFALAAAALFASAPLGSQTASITMEAETMTRSSYTIEGSLIKLTASSGSATKTFTGASGTYNIQVRVLLENDGQSSLELYKGSTRLYTYKYPLGTSTASFTVNNVALSSGETIRLVGRVGGGAWARVDKIVFTPVATSTPAPSTGTGTTAPSTSYTGTPYTGTPVALPKAFAAANFDKGGAGVAYRDLTSGNAGQVYRTTEDVDLVSSTDSSANGYAVNNIQSGEWLNYTVDVPADGKYDLAIRASSNQTTPAAFHIELDGVNVTGPISVPKTASWSTFQWVGKQGVNLTKGRRVLKVVADTQYFNMAALSVLASASATPAPAPSTGTGGSTPTPPIVGDGVGSVTPGPAPVSGACANPSGGYEGFGRNTTGGAGRTLYRVTNLNDSGSGSLRDALSQGNRCVVFDVGGTISLSSDLVVRGANVTIDGLSAPAPGITLRNRTLVMQGSTGSNVVLRAIRHRGTGSGLDAIRVYNASNVVIDRVSVSGFGDGAVDITENSRDVTLQWSILGNGQSGHNFASLIKYNASRITVHHNLYLNSEDRNPHCGRDDGATSAMADIVCDVRNNVIWNYKYYGTAVKTYATANVVNNYYYTTAGTSVGNTIFVTTGGSAYVAGNYSRNGHNLNGNGNRSTPHSAIAPATTDAVTAAQQVRQFAGARGPRFGLDSADQGYIGQVTIAD